jgi:hypothetical protein
MNYINKILMQRKKKISRKWKNSWRKSKKRNGTMYI